LTKFLSLFAAAALIAAACGIGVQAQTPDATPATKEQAVAMVQKAVAFIKAQGPEKGYAAIDDKSGQFVQAISILRSSVLTGRCSPTAPTPPTTSATM
jgi:hypothetical protein